MRFLDKLLHRAPTATTTPVPVSATCLHVALVPRWDSVADMGHEEKATSYRCDSCGKDFTPEETRGLWASAAQRLRGVNEPPSPN